jgi:hypothetical protein
VTFLGLPLWIWKLRALEYREPAHIPKCSPQRLAYAKDYYRRKKMERAA